MEDPTIETTEGEPLDLEKVKGLDDYELFVKSLNWTEQDWMKELLGDDDDEFQLDMEEEDDDDDDDEEEGGDADKDNNEAQLIRAKAHTPISSPAQGSNMSENINIEQWERDLYNELEEELGWLEEEDIQAAVATLLEQPGNKRKADEDSPSNDATGKDKTSKELVDDDEETIALRDVARGVSRTVATEEQQTMLRTLLSQHLQLLLQQAVLAVRSAQRSKLYKLGRATQSPAEVASSVTNRASCDGHETGDELAEILDAAVGMLQDLDQNCKDAIRHFIQFYENEHKVLPRCNNSPFQSPRRLTRAQFAKSLQHEDRDDVTVFAVPGLSKLKETFEDVDAGVEGLEAGQILQLESVRALATVL